MFLRMKHYKMKLFSHETAPFATGKTTKLKAADRRRQLVKHGLNMK